MLKCQIYYIWQKQQQKTDGRVAVGKAIHFDLLDPRDFAVLRPRGNILGCMKEQ